MPIFTLRTEPQARKLVAEKYTDFPVPIPETISHPLPAVFSTIPRTTLPPFTSVSASASLLFPSSTPPSTISSSPTAPTTLNLVSTSAPTTVLHFTVLPISPSYVSYSQSSSTASQSAVPATHKLSITIIAVLAVGSAFLLLGIFIIIKACTRPTRHTRPKPSLPILDEAFSDDNFYGTTKSDSPIFGGNERLSSQTEITLPTWTYYSEAKTEPVPPVPVFKQSVSEIPRALNPIETLGPNDFLFPRPPPSQSVPTTLLSSASQFGVSSVLSTAASRFSLARSVSVYPASPVIPAKDSNNYTAEGHPIMKRSSKLAVRRSRSDMIDVPRMSKDTLAYDGATIKSPQFLVHEAPSAPVGRTRIKSSYYTPGSYPRMSSLPSSTSTKSCKPKPDDVAEFDIQQLPPIIQRTDSRKDRDTRALTSALGLASPLMETIPLSPTQTLYPDDSLSVVGVKRAHSKKLPAAISSGTVDTSTALGSLMLMDFGTTDRSLSTLTARFGEPIEYGFSNGKIQNYDRPPRVPSPPPLPSLAQMGLEHADPEGYADYRSPTYSIFGLYGEDRKSRLSIQRG